VLLLQGGGALQENVGGLCERRSSRPSRQRAMYCIGAREESEREGTVLYPIEAATKAEEVENVSYSYATHRWPFD
jgi:hypothetical protein